MKPTDKGRAGLIGLGAAMWCAFAIPHAHAQQTFLYSAGSGDTTCKFHTNAPTPTTVDFTCTNPRGTFGGYYTPLPANTATDVIITGLEGPINNTGSLTCMMAINMTATPVAIGSFGSVPPASVIFQCAGNAASPVISLTPPAPPPASLKKEEDKKK